MTWATPIDVPDFGAWGDDLMEAALRPRVLCVDDNRDATDSAVELLRIVGFDALGCYDGPHALAVAGQFDPHVYLLDLNMPGMDGDELAAQLRDQAGGKLILFVAITARDDDESRRRTAEAGFEMHLVKPVDPHDLIHVVDALWQIHQSVVAEPTR
jgi:two-component system, OmpR family, response regulator